MQQTNQFVRQIGSSILILLMRSIEVEKESTSSYFPFLERHTLTHTFQSSIKTATKQLFRRLGQSEDNVKMLSLELLQSCMNECGAGFHAEVGKRMKTMSELCTSSKYSRKVQMKAIEMVAKWGRSIKAYGVLQVFYQTFAELKRKGVKFPEKDEGAPMFSPPATSTPPIVVKAKPIVSERQSTTSNTTSTKTSEEQRSRAFSSTEFISKLEMDLSTFSAHFRTCQSCVITHISHTHRYGTDETESFHGNVCVHDCSINTRSGATRGIGFLGSMCSSIKTTHQCIRVG